MVTIAVTYTYADEPARLDAVRAEHRAYLRELHAAGTVKVSGPLPPTDGAPAGALIVLEAVDTAAALALLDADPFRSEGLVTQRTAREWVPVIGGFAP